VITREIHEDETAVAGVKRARVLSLVDRLHRDKAISFDQFAAAGILRSLVMAEAPASQGVSSYGDDAGRGVTPHGKADRLGRRLTGFSIDFDGAFSWIGGRKPLGPERRLEDAIFAALGVYDEAGDRHINAHEAQILISACLDTEDMPSLSGITKQLTSFYRDTSKRSAGYALGVISVWLTRLARHFRLVK
jgi:hypothetical protein